MEHIETVDKLDNEILKAIRHDARLSYSEIGEKVGLSRVAVKNRMAAMQEKGIIKGFETVINATGDPNGIRFFMDIEVEPEKLDKVVGELAIWKMNRQIYACTGESRLHVIGYATNAESLAGFVKGVVRKMDGVRRVIWHILMAAYKDVDRGIDYVKPEEEPQSGEKSNPETHLG